MVYVETTDCCALRHLTCTNTSTIVEMKETIAYDDEERNHTYFAITTEKEKILEKRLIKIGFTHIHTFPSVSSKGKMLKMWIYTAKKGTDNA